MKTITRTIIGVALCAVTALAQNKLEFAEPVRMLSCEPSTTVPCFRMKLNLVDANNRPVGAQLPGPDKLAPAIKVKMGDHEVTPFYAVAGGESTAKVRGRAALVLIDISGSMNRRLESGETRFEAAKKALKTFLDNFEEGSDRVAIVPFESHQVRERIAGAVFARSKSEAMAQVDALTEPANQNNTALFSSVVFGLETIESALPRMQAEAADNFETMLILLTDGSNEVLKGDDAGLLAGPAGLEQAAAAVQRSPVSTVGIGFGERGDIDEASLKRISRKYYMASDYEALRRIFSFTRTLLNNRVTATFASPYPDRASLAGLTLPITAELRTKDGATLASAPYVWQAPQMGIPVYAGKCGTEESAAVLKLPAGSGLTPILRPIGVFCGLGLFLLILWFWIPRLVWADQYIGTLPGTGQARWSNSNTAVRVKDGVFAGRAAPPGFQTGVQGAGFGPRGSGDATIVNPGLSMGQTRLANRQQDPRRPE